MSAAAEVPATSGGPVLVTGGTGFLGRRLVERLLAAGRSVSILSRHADPALERRGVRFVLAPLGDDPRVAEACAGVETVYHVAAKVGVWGPYHEFFEANVLGTRALLRGARQHGVRQFIHTSTPSVVYNGRDLAGADETLPLTRSCPSPYPLTKALAEAEVLAANNATLRTVALRPHLIWGPGDPHLVPRILARARAGRLRIVGHGRNRVDMVHVENAVDAELLAEAELRRPNSRCAGKAYFITNAEPVVLWDWVNGLLKGVGLPAVTRAVPLPVAYGLGAACEALWLALRREGEPPMTRFIAAELAKDHWFSPEAARRDLGYAPRVSMAAGTAELLERLKT
ncbi:NAD-dependent epimerase/dehydratase family protein [Nibricoccus sp. IMCC34717]|uniref:NAD-dependent epimerase/dehydratase family protein n=1 Tax=Nibricoccus sp. IMCC34717 TaxID=3034021 RepID=UPI00384E1088